MTEFDLVIRGGTVATAAGTARCDIGVRDGRIVALAEALDGGREVIDATGKLPKIILLRDLTDLGRGFSQEQLSSGTGGGL